MTTDPPSFAGSYRRIAVAALLCVGSALLAGGAHADPVDAGTPRAPSSSPDSGTGSGAGDAAAPAPAPVDPTAARITKLREQADALNRAAYDRPAPPKPLDRLFSVALNDPAAVSGAMKKLATDRDALVAQVDKWDAILVRLEADLNRSSALLEAQKKRQQRRRRYKIDPALVKAVTEGEALVAQTRQDRDLIDARLSLASARLGFLKRTQPERVRSQKQKAALERRLEQAKKAAEAEQLKAEAEQREAEAERQKALAAQKRARTEAERLVASERARLEDIRARLARHRQAQVTRRAALTREKAKLETFRGEISARADSLQAGWPGTAADYGKLHDRVVSKLRVLRPAAVKELTDRLSARVQVPTPGRRLDTRISDLDPIFQPQVKQLERLRAELVTIEATQAREDARLASERLAFIHKEITWLNQHRIHMLTKVSPEKRAALTGLTRETLAQLSREVLQLTFDGAYWAYLRLNQLLNWRQLLRDFFAIGDLVSRLMQIMILLLLLRLLTRRWDGWLTAAIQSASRSAGIGSGALRLTKLLDLARHCGPALLYLLSINLAYQVLGGEDAVTEIQAVYILFFWIAVYRVQLRLVESAARYTGMEDALRAAEGEELLEEEENLEGPPVPRAVRLAQEAAMAGTETGVYIVPASVLLVRSVRAATRYILVVVLVLRLTALAVGEGTIYGLVAKFSWLAALPFVFYFLQLWRPHISRAYLQYARGRDGRSLAQLVKRSQRRPYGVFVIGAAFLVLMANRLTTFAQRYLGSREATKRLLSFIFRRQVARHAQQTGRVVTKRGDLPGAILREFPDGPLGPDDLRLPVTEMEELVELYHAWEQDHADGSVALVGHTGMGKTTLLRQLEEKLQTPVLRHSLPTKITRPARVVSYLAETFGLSPKPSSEKDLVKQIRERGKSVVALNDCHNLFLRQVGGFEGFESFRRVVNETCDNTFWYLGFNEAAWDFLENFSGRLSYFRRSVRLAPWSERQLRRLIMMRMHRALYRTSFSDLVVAKVQDQDFRSELGRTSKGYFRVLWDFTGGNPKLASHFFLDSLVPHRERRLVQVHLFSEPPMERLEALDDDILFVLTAITEHENLKPEEVARVTNLSLDLCNFACRYCLEGALLKRDRDTGRLRLSPRWQGTVIRFLKRKYLLH